MGITNSTGLSEYVAPTELVILTRSVFYKYVAPTALIRAGSREASGFSCTFSAWPPFSLLQSYAPKGSFWALGHIGDVMKTYWSFKDVPELAELSRPEQRCVHRACYWRAFRSPRCMAALVICGLCAGIGSGLGGSLHWLLGFQPIIWYQAIGGAVGGGIGGFIYSQVVTDYLRPFYADYIKTELRHVA